MPVPNFPEALKPKIFDTITQASEELNLETYVIGGYVRDFLLKRGSAKDIASEKKIEKKVAKIRIIKIAL